MLDTDFKRLFGMIHTQGYVVVCGLGRKVTEITTLAPIMGISCSHYVNDCLFAAQEQHEDRK